MPFLVSLLACRCIVLLCRFVSLAVVSYRCIVSFRICFSLIDERNEQANDYRFVLCLIVCIVLSAALWIREGVVYMVSASSTVR